MTTRRIRKSIPASAMLVEAIKSERTRLDAEFQSRVAHLVGIEAREKGVDLKLYLLDLAQMRWALKRKS